MPHKPQLDGLRFLAFLAVFFFHAKPGFYSWGPQGVQVFFTLSGFLITRILILGESGILTDDLKRFYIRRTLRIFPLYYAVVIWLWSMDQLPGVGWYLAYVYNFRVFLERGWGGPVGHFWTLSVEEQFYLLFPPALLLISNRWRPWMIVGMILATKAFQAYAHERLSIPWASFLLPYCGEHLLWGCVAGFLEVKTRKFWCDGLVCLFIGLALILLTRIRPEWVVHPPPTLFILSALTGFGIGSAFLVFGLWRTSSPWIIGPLAFGPVAYLGRISYGLYVYHLLVIERNWIMYVPEYYLFPEPYGTLLVTIALASASWHFFEQPINQLKERLTVGSGPWPLPWYVVAIRAKIRERVG
ncbi:acyltransferase family protein [Tundrisphaera lichenicola]|uniref:acyltransferase family protein n=1 Tax=Tundrisphaera lichenicola TaxID=2029860 RepID=UPI003EB89516